MEILRSFASSFRSVNRMGNDSSSQVEPEIEAIRPVEKPWDPNDIVFTGDEDDSVATETGPAQEDPETFSKSTQRKRKSKRRKEKRKSKSTSQARSDDGGAASDSKSSDTNAVVETLSKNADPEIATTHDSDEIASGYPPYELQPAVISPPAWNLNEPPSQQYVISSDSNEVASKSSPLQLRLKHDRPRFRCPFDNVYDCGKTFATASIAKRHAQTHVSHQQHVCPVCGQSYSRADKLKTHTMSHNREEVAQATAHSVSQQNLLVESAEMSTSTAEHDTAEDRSQRSHTELPADSQKIPQSMKETVSQNPSGARDRADHSPAKISILSANEFDGPGEPEIVEDTPRPVSRLKRKRESITTAPTGKAQIGYTFKRMRRHAMSPPSSIFSEDEDTHEHRQQDSNVDNSVPTRLPPLSQKKSTRMGNLDNFAKALTPGSQLHHPIHNPRSPRAGTKQIVQVIVPQTSRAGPSTKATPKSTNALSILASDDPNVEQTPLVAKSRKTVYTAPKGKHRAENGVRYFSPPQPSASDRDIGVPEPRGMATSIARRGPLGQRAQKRLRSAEDGGSDANTAVVVAEAPRVDVASRPFVCQECKARFRTKDGLQRHARRPHVHSEKHTCDECSRTFSSLEKLQFHTKATDHGGEQGRKGAFSLGEVRKLQNWRNHFCEENDMTISTFNQMMTDSCRRAKDFQWPYRFISKADFLQEYYDVLPDRNRRSMHRYREREFQNVPEKQEWNEEDDEELMQLVTELGPKWVEIGQRMTRTQDSVNQRWRFKLQYQGKAQQGEWTQSEEGKLKDVVAQVKRESRLPLDPNGEIRIPWDSVSKQMKSKRTAQQCSNKWRLMHCIRRGNIFFKPEENDQKIDGSPNMTTPSKMSLRLSGQTPITERAVSGSKKKVISEAHVFDSDEEDQPDGEVLESGVDQDRGGPDTSAEKRKRTGSSSSSSTDNEEQDTPTTKRNPFPSKTPQAERSLSQTFAQTQANTSALRAPTSLKTHTQTDMPTPGILIQQQQPSSPWKPITRAGFPSSTKSDEAVQQDVDDIHNDQDAIMAELESSETESLTEAIGKVNDVDLEASDATSSDGSDDETEDKDSAVAKSTSDSTSSLRSSPSASDRTSESEEEESEADTEDQDARQDSFLQSLNVPSNRSASSSAPGRASTSTKTSSQKHWERLLGSDNGGSKGSESEDESSDEGDIMHH